MKQLSLRWSLVKSRCLMPLMLVQLILLLAACAPKSSQNIKLGKLTVGVVAYGEGARSVEQYERFIESLEQQTKTLIELEPAYNEVKAVNQIERRSWSLVFAPPGLAAIAVSKAEYIPIFPLEGVSNQASVLVVLKDSPLQTLSDVNGKVLGLGQPGSATGYYVPLYELYGTAPAEVRTAATPKIVMEWLANHQVGVGAVSKDEYDRYRTEFSPAQFRILHTSRRIPSGSVLISPDLNQEQQQLIKKALNQTIPSLAQTVGYVPNAQPPEYKNLITFISKVKPIEARIKQKPAPLYQSGEAPRLKN
jgi:phosphonate transport system substrate-binding protein